MSYSDQHYGAGDPNCPLCGGVGYVSYEVPDSHPQFGKVFPCDCRSGNNNPNEMARLRRLGGLEALADKTFETFDLHRPQLVERDAISLYQAYQTLVRFAENPEGWLLLIGGYGCGKTHLAAAVANAQIAQGKQVLFITTPDLLDYLRKLPSADFDKDDGYTLHFDEVRNIPLLILDDMGTENATPWAIEKLYQILNHRYNARLPTIINTNHDLDEFEPRIRSRLSHVNFCQAIYMTAPDYRMGLTRYSSDLNKMTSFRDKTFESFNLQRPLTPPLKQNLQNVYSETKAFASINFTDPSLEKSQIIPWLVLMGVHGSGKTHLAAAIANVQHEKMSGVMLITTADLLDYLRATYAPGSTVSYDKRFNEVANASLLILDDFGLAAITSNWALVKLRQILSHRQIEHLPTIITTTYRLEEIEATIDARLAAQMRDKSLCRIINVQTPTYTHEEKAFPRKDRNA